MKKTILVADDEPGFRDLFTFFLEPLGYEVTCVEDGEKAALKIQERSFDIVFMDVHMPKMTGSEALKKIRAIRPEQKVVIFSSSSDPNNSDEHAALNEGAVACLFKPVELKDIERILEETFGSRSSNGNA